MTTNQEQNAATTTEQNIQTIADPNLRVVDLERPIIRGSESITQIT